MDIFDKMRGVIFPKKAFVAEDFLIKNKITNTTFTERNLLSSALSLSVICDN